MENFDLVRAGKFGVLTESGTTAVVAPTGRTFGLIKVYVTATFTTLTGENESGDAATSIVYPEGSEICGTFTAFTMTSGAVRAHYNGTN